GEKNESINIERKTRQEDGFIEQRFSVNLSTGDEVRVEKIVGFATSRDFAISEAGLEACKWAARAGTFNENLRSHALAWKHLWKRFNIEIPGGNSIRTKLILRLHCF